MIRYLIIKLVRAGLSAWIVVTTTFVVLRITGDPVLSLLPIDTTPPEIVAHYRQLWGLDRPVYDQYVSYLQGIAQGDMGRSFADGRDAIGIVAEKIPNTLLLMGWAAVAMLGIGLPAGVLAALRRGTGLDRAVMALAVAGHSLPGYLLGILLIWLFAVELQWLPSSGHGTAAHLVLPVLALAAYYGALIARFTRSAVLEVIGRPHVRAAHAQGYPPRLVIRRDVLPNAAIPLVTVTGLILGGFIGGSIMIEWIFAWPGIGRLLVTAVAARDLAVVQVLVLLFAVSMIATNLVVDLLYAVLNPKIRIVAGQT